jgi:hypothetical protein
LASDPAQQLKLSSGSAMDIVSKIAIDQTILTKHCAFLILSIAFQAL